ncbi:MAG: hypothetical protein M3N38_07305 [Pseudomonadota bacterium]|nr:hypothetical protein [Pseudomonadota bacterium]
MFRSPRLSRADARILYEAGDIAEAQMRLAAQVRARTGAFARPFRRFGNPVFLINLALMAAASALLFGAWA